MSHDTNINRQVRHTLAGRLAIKRIEQRMGWTAGQAAAAAAVLAESRSDAELLDAMRAADAEEDRLESTPDAAGPADRREAG